MIKIDAEITEDKLAGHNLILVGGAGLNQVLEKVNGNERDYNK